jgi:chondroitin AC lyase
MIRGYAWDFSITGRGIVGYNPAPSIPDGWGSSFAAAVRGIPAVAPDRAAEANVMVQRLTAQVSPATSGLTGNRSFWCSDYMVHERPGYFLGIRVFSKRTVGSESGNGANLEGYYLGTGVTCLMITGKEYSNIFPLWNWRQIPGTTCAQSNAPYKPITWGGGSRGTTDFDGGASDGAYGAIALDFDRDGIVAKKGWFSFDDEIVCLGAGITATVDDPIDTTIEQNWHNGDLSAGAPGGPITLSATDPTDLSQAGWLLHGTTGYVFPTHQAVKVLAASRTTHPHDILASTPASQTATGDVFSAWIEHGAKPSNASYSYVILPNTDAAKIAAYTPPQIVSNTAQQQIVWHPGLKLAEAIFYSAGSFAIPSGPTITVDQPCVVLVHSVKGTWQVTVSDPTQLLKQITVTVDKTPITFDLPQDIYVGKSVTKNADGTQAASSGL